VPGRKSDVGGQVRLLSRFKGVARSAKPRYRGQAGAVVISVVYYATPVWFEKRKGDIGFQRRSAKTSPLITYAMLPKENNK